MSFSTAHSKVVPLLQFFVHVSAVLCGVCLVIVFSHLYFFRYFEKAVLRDCDISWVYNVYTYICDKKYPNV